MKQKLTIAILATALSGSAWGQSAERGERVFQKCAGCHQIGAGAKNRTGPVLTGVIGRPAASVEGFRYGNALQEAGAEGLVWDGDLIFDWLKNPTDFLRDRLDSSRARSKMSFRLPDDQDRRDVIAYLGTFQSAALKEDRICVVNATAETHLFAVETREGARELATLAPGGELCSEATRAADGIVSIYESAEAIEGCSRIVPTGEAEQVLEYAEFDRCRWGSHG